MQAAHTYHGVATATAAVIVDQKYFESKYNSTPHRIMAWGLKAQANKALTITNVSLNNGNESLQALKVTYAVCISLLILHIFPALVLHTLGEIGSVSASVIIIDRIRSTRTLRLSIRASIFNFDETLRFLNYYLNVRLSVMQQANSIIEFRLLKSADHSVKKNRKHVATEKPKADESVRKGRMSAQTDV